MWKILIWLCLASLPATVFVFWQHVASPVRAGVEAPRVPSSMRVPRAPVGGIRADVPAGAVPAEGAAPLLRPSLSLSLSGHVADLPDGVTPAQVFVRVGSNGAGTFATQSGNAYTVTLSNVDRREMIFVEVYAPRARYFTLLGSAERLKRQAGADGLLTVDENPALRVSALTTAIFFFMNRELEGSLPASEEEFDRALRALYMEDLGPAANMLAKTAAGLTIPDNRANGYELLAHQPAYRTFVLDGAGLGDSDEYLRGLPGVAFAPADLDRDWLLTGRMARVDAPFAAAPVQLMLRTGGGYAVYAAAGRRNPAFTRQLSPDGGMALLPDGVVSYDVMRQMQWGTGTSPFVDVVERHTVHSETHRRLFTANRDSLWLTVREESYRYPQYPDRQGGEVTTAIQVASELGRIAVPAREADLLGRRGAPTFCLQPSPAAGEPALLRDCEYAIHDFAADGTAVIRERGEKIDDVMAPSAPTGTAPLTWTLESGGGLRVAGPGYSAYLWRIGMSEGPADAMVYLATATDADGQSWMAGQTVIVNGNTPASLGPADLPGRWRFGTFGDEHVPYVNTDDIVRMRTRFVRDADGTGERAYEYEFGTEDYAVRYRAGWMVSGARVYDTRYRANVSPGQPYSGTYFSSCAAAFAAGATQCAPHDARIFRPLARVGLRWYGIEDVYTRDTGAGYAPPFTFQRFSRANMQEKRLPTRAASYVAPYAYIPEIPRPPCLSMPSSVTPAVTSSTACRKCPIRIPRRVPSAARRRSSVC